MTNKIDNSTISVFNKKRKEQGNDALMNAQRLVNLYRHASAFGDDFIQKFNQELLQASPEVQTVLSDIVGGNVVRQYYDFLKENATDIKSDNDKTALKKNGYLPSPDEDNAISYPLAGDTVSNVDTKGLEKLFREISEANRVTIEKQNQFLTDSVNKLSTTDNPNGTKQLAEIMGSAIEKLIQSQTDVLLKAFQQFHQTTQNVANQQTNRLIEVIKQEGQKRSRYSDIIEFSTGGAEQKNTTEKKG